MIRIMVQYRAKAGEVDAVERAVADFVAAIAVHEPNTIYGAFRGEEPTQFYHMMSFPDEDAAERHRTAEYTLRFVDALYPRCQAEPTFTGLSLIQSTKTRGGGFLGMGG